MVSGGGNWHDTGEKRMEELRSAFRQVRRRLLWVLFCFAWLVSGLGRPAAVRAEDRQYDPLRQGAPRFEEAPCMVDLLPGLIEGQDVVCGYLSVPAKYADPAGPTIRLGVAILKSLSPDPEPDPLVLLQGGPGGSTIDTYLQAIPTTGRLRADRDIVLFDQRGTLNSEPALDCPEFMDLTIETLDRNLSDEEDIRLSLAAVEACRARLAGQGIDLNAYDTLENAADVESLRQALGYDQINLYGVSYGSLLAQQVLRAYPGGLRSVILDAVVPPQVNFNFNAPRTMNRSFEELFAACAQDADCGAGYPNLREVFYQQVDRLNENPVTISLTDIETGRTYQALLDGESFMGGIFQMLYATEIIPFIPRIIYDARAGDYGFFSRILGLFTFDRSVLYGMYYSVQCAEETGYSPEDYDLSGLPEQIQQMEDISAEFFLQACEIWNVEPAPGEVNEPVRSNVPTLVLSGRFDPITPPAYGEQVAEGLANAQIVVFPNGGHGSALSGECQDQVILDFLANPAAPADTSCVEAIAGPDFVTPGALVRLPKLAKLLNLEDGTLWQAILYVLALLFLLTALLVYPLAWVVRQLRRKPAQPGPVQPAGPMAEAIPDPSGGAAHSLPGLARLAPWLAVLAALSLLVFTAVFIGVVVNMVISNDMRILLGLPGAARPLFVLPLLVAGLAILMIGAALAGWTQRGGSLAGRLYFSLLTLAALVCAAVLAAWGMVTALFSA
jgi:pimeloyl-ACP methyl ester carboxylesterase